MDPLSQAAIGKRKRGLRRFSALLGISLVLAFSARADESLEYEIKAAFLLNFTKFIEWPPTAFIAADSPIAICILGEDWFGATLDRMVAGEVVKNRPVVVHRIKRPPREKSCQVVFISTSEKNISKIIADLEPGVLTVGEGEDFVREGGMIAFVIESRRVRFSINRPAAERAGLKLSSKLLNIAIAAER